MASFADKILRKTQSALLRATQNRKHLDDSIKEYNGNLRRLRTALKKASTSAEKTKLNTTICLMKKLRQKMKSLKNKKDKPNKVSRRVKWDDVHPEFNNGIRTGIIINLVHTEPSTFLEDCISLFRLRINNVLKIVSAIQASAVFCVRFKSISEETYKYKYLETQNKPIYKNTNLNEWFKEKIRDQILKDLEIYQINVRDWILSGVINLLVHVNMFTPMLQPSHIELPSAIKTNDSNNVRNNDNAHCSSSPVVSAPHYQSGKSAYYNSTAANETAVLNELNSFSYKNFIKLADLKEHVPYKIIRAKRFPNVFGERTVVEIQNGQLYLPTRYDKLSAEILDRINQEGNYYITIKGKIGQSYDLMFTQLSE